MTVPGCAAAGDEPLLAPVHRDDDARDDAQRVGADRDRPEVPHPLRRARDVGQDGGRHTATVAGSAARTAGAPVPRRGRSPLSAVGARTPSASSAASARAPPAPPCSTAVTNAEPTITPSANAATSAACAPRPHAQPDADRQVGVRRGTRCDERGAASPTRVAGAGDAHRRRGVEEPAGGGRGRRDPLLGRRRRDQEDPVEAVRVGGREPLVGLVGDEVRRDHARAPPAAARSRANASTP